MPIDPAKLAPAGVRTLAPYIPGKPLEELEREYGIRDSIKLASNENPLGPGRRALEAIAQASRQIGLYPDGSGFKLKQALARKHGCGTDCITLGNGSNDVLVLIAEAFLSPQSEAVYSQYTFAVYPIAVQATGATARVAPANPDGHAMPLGHDLAAMAKLINERTRLVFVANPNNPTGTFIDGATIEAFLSKVPRHVAVVLDEAYTEYLSADKRYDSIAWVRRYPNLLVSRTFSKAFGLAGLRVGFAIAQPELTDLMNRLRQPFNVNTLAQAAAIAALNDKPFLQKSAELNAQGYQRLTQAFDKLGLEYVPSHGNFVLVRVGNDDGAGNRVNLELLKQGVIVRPVGSYGLPQWLRVTIGLPEENEAFIAALEKTLATS
jgi:histidinol-phosphate aminotransferase